MSENISRLNRRYLIAWIFLVLLVLIVSQLLLFSRGIFAISADEAGHTLEAFQWYRGESPLFSIWLPFQKIIYGLSLKIYFNLIWTPRILSSLFGALTILSLMFLTFELFRKKTTLILSGMLGAIFPCLVIFSVLPLTEIYFFFFTISSIALLFNWRRTGSIYSFILVIFFSSIGTTTRYEAWPFSFIIFLILIKKFYRDKEKFSFRLLRIFLIFIFLFVFPMYWIYLSYHTTGDVLAFLHSVSSRYSHRTSTNGPQTLLENIKNNVGYYFIMINVVSLNIIGLSIFFYYFKKSSTIKLYAFIILTTLIGFSILTYFSNAMPTHNAWRLASIWSIMLIPFTAQSLYLLVSDERPYLKHSFVILFLLIIYFFNIQTSYYTNFRYMTRQDLEIGKFINTLNFSDESSKIYIERGGWQYMNLMVASQNPQRFLTENQMKNPTSKADSISAEQISEFEHAGIQYLILTYRMKQDFGTNYLQRLKQFNNWSIYKIK